MPHITPGTYAARPVTAQLGQTPTTGTPYIEVLFRIAAAPGHTHGSDEIRWTGWLSPAAQQRTFESLWVMGWQDDLNDLTTLTEDVQIVVADREADNGKIYSEVKWVNRLNSNGHLAPPKSALDAGTIASLSAKARAARAASAATGATRGPAGRLAPHAGPRAAPVTGRTVPMQRAPDPRHAVAAGHDVGPGSQRDFADALADDDIPF